MNYVETDVAPLLLGDEANGQMQYERMRALHRGGPSQRASNWAWATALGHHDWMDSYAAFVSLD